MQRGCFLFLLLFLTACGGHEVDFARSLAVRAPADLILRNGKIITVDRDFSVKQAVAIRDGRIVTVGGERDVRVLVGPKTRVIDLDGHTVIPGLIDSHIQATLAGLSWDTELHWQLTRTLADGLSQIAAAAKVRLPGSWIVVGGGWVPTQFAERRFPTRADLDALAPQHPVYIQYLRQGALLNTAALKAIGITTSTPDPVGGKFEHDPNTGELTGWLHGAPAWENAYKKLPPLRLDRIRQSLRNCFRELNRLGVTSVGDFQSSAVTFAHRRVLADMARAGELSLRVNFYVEPSRNSDEIEQIKLTLSEIGTLQQSDLLRFAGFRAAADSKEGVLSADALERFRRIARFLVAANQNFQVDAADDLTASQIIAVLEELHAATPFQRQRIGFTPLDDASAETAARIKKLGGGVLVQSGLALTGERYAELHGLERARSVPPLRTMIKSGIALSAGTGAFHAASYSPMLSLWWLVTGKTVAGSALRGPDQNLTRAEALRLYTMGGAWQTYSEGRRGSIEAEKLADLVVLNADYLTVPEDQIRAIESLLTIVGGRIVYAAGPFAKLER